MKKWRFFAICFLLLFAVVSLKNKAVGQISGIVTLDSDTTSDKQSTMSEPVRTSGDVPTTDNSKVVKEYPNLGIVIDATCPDIELYDIPVLSAHISDAYFNNMLGEFLNCYPDAKEIDNNHWSVHGLDKDVLAYISLSEMGRFDLGIQELDVNGSGSEDKYHHFTDGAIINPDSDPFLLETAISNSIQMLTPYTDFDLVAYNAVIETDSLTERSWYRMGLQLFYKGIPVSVYTKEGRVGLNIGIADAGIGYMQGFFNFEKIEENDYYHVISLSDVLTIFEEQGYKYLSGETSEQREVYWIQLEYAVEFDRKSDVFSFRPVWTFYYTYYPASSDYSLNRTLKFCADSGDIYN